MTQREEPIVRPTFVLEKAIANFEKYSLKRQEGNDTTIEVKAQFVAGLPVAVLSAMGVADAFSNSDATWRDLLFNPDGSSRELGLKELTFTRKFEEHILELAYSAAGQETRPRSWFCDLSGFKAAPWSNGVVLLTFVASFSPALDQVHWLTNAFANGLVFVRVRPQQDDMFDTGTGVPDDVAA